jgi:hypothetical protein
MGLCRYCGAKAGWFSDVHDECVRSAEDGCAKVCSLIAATLEKPVPTDHPDFDKWYSLYGQMLWAEVKPEVEKLQSEHRIPADQVRGALRRGWIQGAARIAIAVLVMWTGALARITARGCIYFCAQCSCFS